MAGIRDLSSGWKNLPLEDPKKCGIRVEKPSAESMSVRLR
jgi:hypothetical protein